MYRKNGYNAFWHFFLVIYSRLFYCNHICYCVGMVSVRSESRYLTSLSRSQSRFSMSIRGLITWISMEMAEAVPIVLI